MVTIDRALLIQHIKSDGDASEDDLLDMYLASAVSICEGYCNRKFYQDEAEFYTAFDDGLVALAAARDWFNEQTAATESCEIKARISDQYIQRRGAALAACNGCVADGTVLAAILLTFGHLYRNRQDNVVGNMAAVQLPVGAQRILQPYLWIGDLAGGS